MVKVNDILNALFDYAPLSYQESYDNSGVQVGDLAMEVDACLIALDCSEKLIDEALSRNIHLVITHHPLIFSGIKSLTGKNEQERILLKAIKNNIAILSVHTNLDKVHNGVSYMLGEKIGLENMEVLVPEKGLLKKMVAFCPQSHSEVVKTALFNAGGGDIGAYAECSYSVIGEGSFRAKEGASPFVGEVGKRHIEKEERIELVFPADKQSAVLHALLHAHPYEEVAYDVYSLENVHPYVGLGVVGDLPQAKEEAAFLSGLASSLGVACVRHSAFRKGKIKRVALCGGSGAGFVEAAIGAKADAYVTGDVKYHAFQTVENDILLADIGHFESEQFTKELLFEIITKKIPNFATYIYDKEQNPVRYFVTG